MHFVASSDGTPATEIPSYWHWMHRLCISHRMPPIAQLLYLLHINKISPERQRYYLMTSFPIPLCCYNLFGSVALRSLYWQPDAAATTAVSAAVLQSTLRFGLVVDKILGIKRREHPNPKELYRYARAFQYLNVLERYVNTSTNLVAHINRVPLPSSKAPNELRAKEKTLI